MIWGENPLFSETPIRIPNDVFEPCLFVGSIVQHFIRLATWAPEAVMRGEAVDAIALVLRSWRFRDSGTEDRKEISVFETFEMQVCGGNRS